MYALMANQREHEDYPEGLTPFKDYPVSNLTLGFNNDIAGKITLDNGQSFFFVSHSLQGFIVKRVYTENPDETDPVLRKWGTYEDYQYFSAQDRRLRHWMGIKMDDLGLASPQLCVKITQRLLAFEPMRSKIAHGKIAIFQCQKDRDNDRQVAMKPGRALTLMFPELDHKSIITLVDEFLQEFAPRNLTLRKSRDADDFIKAYSHEQSPKENIDTTWSRKSSASSCMRHEFEHLSTHPVAAYASGDFEIVYTTDQDDRIASRCVVWMTHPDDIPQAGPVYGVSEQSIDMIDAYLNSIGATFSKDASWVGAKLKAIHHGEDQYVAPYLDLMPQSLMADGEYLTVDDCGDISASDYGGVLGNGYTCTMCDCTMSEDETYYSETTGEIYCSDCYYERHFHCEYAQEDYHVDDGTVTWSETRWGIESQLVSNDRLTDNFVHCEIDGTDDDEWWHADDALFCESEEKWISPRNRDEYFTSDWDDQLYPRSVMCETVDGDAVARDELDEDWELNSDDLWEKKQEEMDI